MEALIISEGQSTPDVVFNPTSGKFRITGNSLPEDVLGFYSPIFTWVKEYALQPNAYTEVEVKLNYFNSASSKAILDILSILESITQQGKEVKINWHYNELDEDMLAIGREFESMLKIPFEFFSYIQE